MTIEERLEKLERELRTSRKRNRLLLSLAFAVGVAASLGASAGPRTEVQETSKLVRAERFELVDKNGKLRATLAVDEEGAGLNLIDESGKPRATIAVSNDGPSLSLTDANVRPRATLFVTKAGVKLKLSNEDGKEYWSISR